jgi:hypothetical protein
MEAQSHISGSCFLINRNFHIPGRENFYFLAALGSHISAGIITSDEFDKVCQFYVSFDPEIIIGNLII